MPYKDSVFKNYLKDSSESKEFQKRTSKGTRPTLILTRPFSNQFKLKVPKQSFSPSNLIIGVNAILNVALT